MAAPRGRQQRGRSTGFPSDKAIRAGLMLYPGEAEREAYEALVSETGLSGAEVIRKALLDMHKKHSQKRSAGTTLQEAG
ncbi:hypothetical protein ACFXKW_20790 [Streptomyces sp. NPDC059193]|uniref:hypothetical protein n=1 Tax=Streptomyces sp. NPDC059193 TaxID=3346763 RepID=UPI0036C4DDAE